MACDLRCGKSRIGLVLIILAGIAFTDLAFANEPARPAKVRRDLPRSSGEYLGHRWHIDANHLMWWDGKPYVPFGGFGVRPGDGFGLDTQNLWIDFDPFMENPQYTREEHRRAIAARLAAIRETGGTCIVQLDTAQPHIPDGVGPGVRWIEPEGGIDASRLADPQVRQAIFRVWADYAPTIRNECVRGLVLWNEINLWRWPERFSPQQYAEILHEYVREAKRLVGDLPVCFKAAGMWRAEPVIAAAAVADGLGFDIWFSRPDDRVALREIGQTRRQLEWRQKKTTWFFIAEGGRVVGKDGEAFNYPDAWPPFTSKEDAREILQAYARAGAKGFIYNGPTPERHPQYRDSYRWLGQVRSEITELMIQTHVASERQPPGSAEAAIHAARGDRRVREMLKGMENVQAEAEFADEWDVWLVRFIAGGRTVVVASVTPQGTVVEAGRGEEGPAEPLPDTSSAAGNSPAEKSSVYDVLHWGAQGDGRANDARAIQKAIDACHEAGGFYDTRPGIHKSVYEHKTAGVFIQHARDVTLSEATVVWGQNPPDYFGPALETHDVTGLELDRFKGIAAHPGKDRDRIIEE